MHIHPSKMHPFAFFPFTFFTCLLLPPTKYRYHPNFLLVAAALPQRSWKRKAEGKRKQQEEEEKATKWPFAAVAVAAADDTWHHEHVLS